MTDPPNILLIMSDQHAPNLLGCYGDPLVRTPNLDRLATEGMRFTNAYCPFLQERSAMETPFAAVTGFLLPHCPYIGPKAAFDYYFDRVPTTPEAGGEPDCIQALYKWRNLDPPATAHQLRVARAAYYAMIEYVDMNIGRILDVLDQSGQAENTLVIYCSDHGEMLGEHNLWSKKCFYEHSARIPLIARMPGVTTPGNECAALCSLLDLAPTFAELADAAPMDTDGKSLFPLFHGDGNPGRVITSEVADMNGGSFEWLGKMVRKGDWKLWQHHRTEDDTSFPPALFNLADDPNETCNLAANPEHTATRDELLAQIEQDWNPSAVAAEVKQQLHDWRVLCQWGKIVQPLHPDTYVWPGEETEADIELISLQKPKQK
ncbi:MAG: sulfatase-like hydrolase/transferase [Candidatus Marinimicrobia bacterium]|nr:sulfatase-like hydrolase/transferase [Candidatus Neomarinimicrobiota bacterium]